jgi:hypothetical protein
MIEKIRIPHKKGERNARIRRKSKRKPKIILEIGEISESSPKMNTVIGKVKIIAKRLTSKEK